MKFAIVVVVLALACGIESHSISWGVPAVSTAYISHSEIHVPVVAAEGSYVAKTQGAVHVAPLAGHVNSAVSINLQPAPGTVPALPTHGGLVAAQGEYVAKTQGAVHVAPLAGHANSVASINTDSAPGTIHGVVAPLPVSVPAYIPAVSYAAPAVSYAAPAVSYAAPTVVHTPVVAAEGQYVAKTQGAVHVAPLAGHVKSVDSINIGSAPGTIHGWAAHAAVPAYAQVAAHGPIFAHSSVVAHGPVVAHAPVVAAEGSYVAKTRGAVHVAPLAGHVNSAASINLQPAPGTF